jgi:hypothetical protein
LGLESFHVYVPLMKSGTKPRTAEVTHRKTIPNFGSINHDEKKLIAVGGTRANLNCTIASIMPDTFCPTPAPRQCNSPSESRKSRSIARLERRPAPRGQRESHTQTYRPHCLLRSTTSPFSLSLEFMLGIHQPRLHPSSVHLVRLDRVAIQ